VTYSTRNGQGPQGTVFSVRKLKTEMSRGKGGGEEGKGGEEGEEGGGMGGGGEGERVPLWRPPGSGFRV
jgi:hypothetical protein